jgi:hypothetical protein
VIAGVVRHFGALKSPVGNGRGTNTWSMENRNKSDKQMRHGYITLEPMNSHAIGKSLQW